MKEQLAEENVLVLFRTKRNKVIGTVKNHRKLQVIKSTDCSLRMRLNSLARVPAYYMPDKIARYCV